MTFTVGNIDYSGHVIAGTYNVNNKPQYRTWTDADYHTRKIKLRDQIVGSFDMFFRTQAEYEDFMDDIATATGTDNAVSISLTVNNTSEQANINAFIDYELVRNIDGAWNDYFERFTVNIEER